MIQKIASSCNSSDDQVVDLSEMILNLTSVIICSVDLGKKYSGEEVGKKLDEILGEIVYLLGVLNVGDFIPWLGWVNHFNGLNARTEKCFREMDCFLEVVIEEHIESMKKGEAGTTDDGQHHEYKEDLVDVLLVISFDKDHAVFLLIFSIQIHGYALTAINPFMDSSVKDHAAKNSWLYVAGGSTSIMLPAMLTSKTSPQAPSQILS